MRRHTAARSAASAFSTASRRLISRRSVAPITSSQSVRALIVWRSIVTIGPFKIWSTSVATASGIAPARRHRLIVSTDTPAAAAANSVEPPCRSIQTRSASVLFIMGRFSVLPGSFPASGHADRCKKDKSSKFKGLSVTRCTIYTMRPRRLKDSGQRCDRDERAGLS